MSHIETCTIIANEDSLLRERYLDDDNDPSFNIPLHTVNGGISFLAPGSDELRTIEGMPCDLLIIEDQFTYAGQLAVASLASNKIKHVVVATSEECVRALLETSWRAAPIITLDFSLQQGDSDTAFKATRALYADIKQTWNAAKVMGVSAHVFEGPFVPNKNSAALVAYLRSNGDSVFQKDDTLIQFLPQLIADAFLIGELRCEKDRAEDRATLSTLERNEAIYLRSLPLSPPEAELPPGSPSSSVIGDSLAMRHVYFYMSRRAGARVVSLEGDSGTGKKEVARGLHRLGPRSKKEMVVVECGRWATSSNPDLLESALFGYERGSFTGAEKRTDGFFKKAHGGTIFLDEIGELSEGAQLKLFEVVETGEYNRLGGTERLKDDVNVITATDKSLAELVANGQFRRELFYRLTELPFPRLPKLGERNLDILQLADHFVNEHNRVESKQLRLSEGAYRRLCNYSWPGNVRELRNVINGTLSLISSKSATVEADNLVFSVIKALDQPPERLNYISYSGFENKNIAKAADWLDAIEESLEVLAAEEISPTNENVGRNIRSPKGEKAAVTGQRISQVRKELGGEMICLLDTNLNRWHRARDYFKTRVS